MNEDFSFVTPPTASQQRERAERIKLTPASFAVVVNTYYTFLNRSRLETRQTVANIKGQIKTASSKAERSELKAELRELQSYCRMTKRASNFMKRMLKRKARALSLPFDNLEQLNKNSNLLTALANSFSEKEVKAASAQFQDVRNRYTEKVQRQPHVDSNVFDNVDAQKIRAAVQDVFADKDAKTVKDVTNKVVDHYQKTISDDQLDDLLNDGKLRGTGSPTAAPEQSANPLPTLGGPVANDLPKPEEEKTASQSTDQPKRPDVIPMGGPVLDSPDTNPLPPSDGSAVNDLPEPEEEKTASQPTDQPRRPDTELEHLKREREQLEAAKYDIPRAEYEREAERIDYYLNKEQLRKTVQESIDANHSALNNLDQLVPRDHQDRKEMEEERRRRTEEIEKSQSFLDTLNNGSVFHSESSIFDQPSQSKDEDVDLLDELISQLQQKKSEYENNSAKLTDAKKKLAESERDVQNAQKTLDAVTGLVKDELAKLDQQNRDVLDKVSQTQQQITNNQRRIERINDTRQSIQNLVGESAAMSNGRTR